eukprot:scaffold18563_cov132-Cylindrotheca_fusiformis.AAC.8
MVIEDSTGVIHDMDDAKTPYIPPQKQRSRTIQFAPYDDVLEIPHISDLTDEEIDEVYIHPDDFNAMRRECLQLVAVMEKGHPVDFCIRGLDQHVPDYLKMRDALRDLLYETVGRIQSMEDDGDDKDYSDVMGQLCETCSRTAVSNAIARGMADAREVNSSDQLVGGL